MFTHSDTLLHCNPYPNNSTLPVEPRGCLHLRMVLYALTKVDNLTERLSQERHLIDDLIAKADRELRERLTTFLRPNGAPNGAPLPGGNIELLAVPSYVLGADPSTSRSRFDIDADPNFPAAPSSARSTISNATASPCAGSVSDLEFLEPPTPRALEFSPSATQRRPPQGVVERANLAFAGKLSKWMRDQRTKT